MFLLKSFKRTGIGIFLFLVFINASGQTPVFIPDTLTGPNYNLTVHNDSVQFFPTGKISHTFGFNSYKYLGPTLIFNKWDSVTISITNHIGDTTTIHWHGFHVPAKWDGGPHSPILNNTTWTPAFKIRNSAATYWYHPHTHGKTALQAIKGADGMIIVRDSIESALVLPRKYGVDDFPIIVQCLQYDSLNQAMPLGMQDSTLLVNGTRANYGDTAYLNLPAQVVRLRLLNASGERVFNFGFTANRHFYQIASDGGLLSSSHDTTRIRLAPGERAEILLNLVGMNGQTFYLMCYGSEIPMGTQGGPTMIMSGPPMNSPLNGVNYNILELKVVPQTVNPVTSIPASLTPVTPYLESNANATRIIRFTAASDTVMDGPFYFNDSTFNMMRIDYTIPINSTEIWTLVNKTMVAHPFHIHDEQFYVLDRNGLPPDPSEKGKKDVILVAPNDSVRFITKFTDFADTTIPYMYHCHILMHEDAGMMGQFVVSPFPLGVNEIRNLDNAVMIYPNPTSDYIYVGLKEWKENTTLILYNTLGQKVLQAYSNGRISRLSTASLSSGIYLLTILTSDGNTLTRKVSIAK